jgi:poly(3-hydroxybutyrate) depolymerase
VTETLKDIFVPQDSSVPRPLLVPFHGGGRDGASQIELWTPIAEREQFILLAPTSGNGWWGSQNDFENVAAQINAAVAQLPVDKTRVYFFGHSLGAVRALDWGYTHRHAIAAIALHSPTMVGGIFQLKAEQGTRRLPMGVWVGEENCDSNWHCGSCLEFSYKKHPNFSVDLRVLPKHYHNDIYTRPGLTDEIWSFLKQQSL